MDKSAPAHARKRLDNLDLMKALGILMVLTLHVPLWNLDFFEGYRAARLVQYALRLVSEGVPLFVMVNGFLLFRKSTFSLKQHVVKMARMFVLLVVWCVILTLAGMSLDRAPQPITLRLVVHYVFQTQVGSPYTGVLWFLQNLLGVYLLFPALRAVHERNDRMFGYLFWVVAFFTVGQNTLGLVRDFVAPYCDISPLSECIAFLERCNPVGNGWYLFYFMLGGMVLNHQKFIRRHRALFSLVGLASWGVAFAYGYAMCLREGWVYNQAFNYSTLMMALWLVGMFAFTLPYKNRGGALQRFAAGVGQNTFGIYLTHYLFIFAIYRFFDLDTGLRRALAYVAVFFASHLFSMLVRKIPGLRQLMNIG